MKILAIEREKLSVNFSPEIIRFMNSCLPFELFSCRHDLNKLPEEEIPKIFVYPYQQMIAFSHKLLPFNLSYFGNKSLCQGLLFC